MPAIIKAARDILPAGLPVEVENEALNMDTKREMLRHFLAALAYRTQKALRGAPPEFAAFQAGQKVRTPLELVRHMDSLMGYARTYFIGGSYRPPELEDFQATI